MSERFLTIEEIVRDYLPGADVYSLRRMCRIGKLEGAVRFGKQWRIPEATIKKMLKLVA